MECLHTGAIPEEPVPHALTVPCVQRVTLRDVIVCVKSDRLEAPTTVLSSV
jgi:hypothetical protein